MKKNILTVVILAATLVNLTLTAIIIFTFIPYVNRANTLITNILQVIDLELLSPEADEYASSYKIEDLATTAVLTEEMVNLKPGDNGKMSYATVSASISVNTKHEDYKDKNPLIEANKDEIVNSILVEIGKYTGANCLENKEAIEAAVLQKLQTYFGSRFIVKVTIKMLVQN